MRGWTSMLVGFLLLGVAYWSFAAEGLGSSTLLCAAAAAFFFFRGSQGLTVGEVGDPTAVIEFVQDPADAIVDSATERFADWLNDRPKGGAADQPGFDADAVIERYLAQRGPDPLGAPAAAPASPAPYRGFGRKGV
ncbi:MAG: hypothetical protein ACR2KH_05375 [Sphingomicrobium sp.]